VWRIYKHFVPTALGRLSVNLMSGHKFLFSKQGASFSRNLFCAGPMGRPKIWMIRDRCVFRINPLRRCVQQMKTFGRNSRNHLGCYAAPWE
jgi:hypothetical protein